MLGAARQQGYLDSHGIARHQYYRWKRKYREEDEQSLVPAGFVPMMLGAVPAHDVEIKSGIEDTLRLPAENDITALLPENWQPVTAK